MRRIICAMVAGLLGMANSAEAAPIELHRGVGVHGWLNWAPINPNGTYVWPPYRSYDAWLASERPASDWPAGDQFVRIKSMGFDFIRLTVDPGPLLATTGGQRQQALGVLKLAVERVTQSGLKVVFNLHSVEQIPAYGAAVINDSAGSQNIARYRAMAVDVAAMLVQVGTGKVAFEPFNEPAHYEACYGGGPDWQQIMAATVTDIRAVSPDLTIVATGACGGSIDGLIALDPTGADANILFSFHMYEPHSFTHQRPDPAIGTTFSSGLPWPVTPPFGPADWVYWMKVHMTAMGMGQAEQQMNLNKQAAAVADYFNQNWGQAQLTARVKQATDWAAAYGIPKQRLFMGEFGTILMPWDQSTPPGSYMGTYEADRSNYVKAVRQTAEADGIPWSTWEYSNPYGMSVIVPQGPAVPDGDLLHALGLP